MSQKHTHLIKPLAISLHVLVSDINFVFTLKFELSISVLSCIITAVKCGHISVCCFGNSFVCRLLCKFCGGHRQQAVVTVLRKLWELPSSFLPFNSTVSSLVKLKEWAQLRASCYLALSGAMVHAVTWSPNIHLICGSLVVLGTCHVKLFLCRINWSTENNVQTCY